MSYHHTKGHVFGVGSNKYVVGARIDVAVKVIYTEHLTVIVQKESVFSFFFFFGVSVCVFNTDMAVQLTPPLFTNE